MLPEIVLTFHCLKKLNTKVLQILGFQPRISKPLQQEESIYREVFYQTKFHQEFLNWKKQITVEFFKNSGRNSNRHRLIYKKIFEFIYKLYWFLPFSSLVNWIGIRWIMLKYYWLPKCMGWGNQWNNSCKISWNHVLMAYDSDFWFTYYWFRSLCWR